MNKKSINPVTIIKVIFSIIGAAFLIIGIFSGMLGISSSKKGEEVTAVISDMEIYTDVNTVHMHKNKRNIHREVFVDYEYDGVSYSNVALNYYTSSMRIGDKINIKIDPMHPEKPIAFKAQYIIGGVFSIIGIIFTIISLVIIIKESKSKKKIKALVEYGNFVYAKINSIKTTNVYINNKPTYVVKCSYYDQDEGKERIFTSERLIYDPTPYISSETIKVYVDENNMDIYYVNISELKDKYIES